jgi:hypothetical protein
MTGMSKIHSALQMCVGLGEENTWCGKVGVHKNSGLAFLRFAVLPRSKDQGSPSMVNPLGGRKAHRTFLFFHLTPAIQVSPESENCRLGRIIVAFLHKVTVRRPSLP